MKKLISITTAAEFADALEDWIIDNKCNPTSPEEWSRCIKDLVAQGKVHALGCVDDSEDFKSKLKENLNVEDLNNGDS